MKKKKQVFLGVTIILIVFLFLFKFNFSVFTSINNVRLSKDNQKYYVYIKEDNKSKTIKAECNKKIYDEIENMDKEDICTFNIKGTNIFTRFIPKYTFYLDNIEK